MRSDIFNCYEFCRNAKDYSVPVTRCFDNSMTFKLRYKEDKWRLMYYEGSTPVDLGNLKSPKVVYEAVQLIKEGVEGGTIKKTKWYHGRGKG